MREHKSFIYNISHEEERILEKNTLAYIAWKKEIVIEALEKKIPIETIEYLTCYNKEEIRKIKQAKNEILD